MTALLESRELIVGGDISARAPLHALEQVGVRGDSLELTVAGDRVSLALGAVSARRWAAAIATPLPTPARKLGITAATQLHVTGPIDDDGLAEACACAANVVPMDAASLVIIRCDDRAVLESATRTLASHSPVPPCWIVYIKGSGAPLGERGARNDAAIRFYRYESRCGIGKTYWSTLLENTLSDAVVLSSRDLKRRRRSVASSR